MDEKQFASHMLKILQENIQDFISSKPVISIKKPLSVAEFEKLNLNYKNFCNDMEQLKFLMKSLTSELFLIMNKSLRYKYPLMVNH